MAYRHVAGWDVGGVNTKVAHVDGGRIASVCGRPFELQRAPDRLVTLLRELASEAGCPAGSPDVLHAVTMTAELSQMFRTKREGVSFVLDAIETAFPSSPIRVYAVDGRFLPPADARADPLAVAAANWSATAHLVALDHPDALLIDVGTTTTDIIPIVGGLVVARGQTDPGRLASGELVYTGALRTPAEAIASEIPLRGETVGVSAEGFALAGDVHLWRGDVTPADYTVATPDGRPPTKEFAGERLARVICADREMLDETSVSLIAEVLASAQAQRIATAIRQVVARHPSLDVAVTTGLGAFLAAAAARTAGLKIMPLAAELGEAAARFAPAASVALLGSREQTRSVGEAQVASPESQVAIVGARDAHREPRDVHSELRDVYREPRDVYSTPPDVTSEPSGVCSSGPRRVISEPRAASRRPSAASPEPNAPNNEPSVASRGPSVASSEHPVASPEPRAPSSELGAPSPESRVDVVVKVGGSLLSQPQCLDRVLALIASKPRERRLLVVPGGGPFADVVRKMDGEVRLSDEAAHWMAVLAMDQYAHLIADRVEGGLVVESADEITSALCSGRVPVLAPSQWLRAVDPLPHSWAVTSDSIAAWVAGALGAGRVVLVKPSGAAGVDLVDSHFSHALPAAVEAIAVPADRLDQLRSALHR